MKILVVDDLREFRKAPAAEVVYSRTSVSGLRQLKADKTWNQIYLDHDLGMAPNGGCDSISPVLKYIESHVDEFDTRTEFFVITSNPYAASMMVRSLKVCGLKTQRLNPYDHFHYVW